jgi:hypothetical protein
MIRLSLNMKHSQEFKWTKLRYQAQIQFQIFREAVAQTQSD